MDNKKYDKVMDFSQGIAIVEKSNKFGAIIVGGKEIIRPIYSNLTVFNNGVSTAEYVLPYKYKRETRFINIFGQIQVKHNEEDIFLPEIYDWGYDFVDDMCVVVKDNLYGVIDKDFNVLIDCKYIDVEPLSPSLCKVREDNHWRIINKDTHIVLDYVFSQFSRKILVEGEAFWIVTLYDKNGVINSEGEVIIPVLFDKVEVKATSNHINVCFYCYTKFLDSPDFIKYSKNRECIIENGSRTQIIPSEYEMAFDAGLGMVRVLKNGKWGLLDSKNNVVVDAIYSYIGEYCNGFAIVGNGKDDEIQYFIQNSGHSYKTKVGLIDTLGEIVLPIEYDSIRRFENGLYCVNKRDQLRILSNNLSVIFESSDYGVGSMIDNLIVFYQKPKNSTIVYCGCYGLMDVWGNILIPSNYFEKIEAFKDGFYKVIYHKDRYVGSSHLGIINNRGTLLYESSYLEDIEYLGNGLFKTSGFCCTDRDSGYIDYNIINVQGKEMFDKDYKQILSLDDGNYSIEDCSGWGLADHMGKVIVYPVYRNEIKYEKGYSEIQLKTGDSINRINRQGNVIVKNGEEDVLLPTRYYWGTIYVNNVSLVRSKKTGYIGVIDLEGKEILPALFKSVELLADNTLLVRQGDCYGIYDLSGNCIFPVIFTTIEYLKENRIYVEWNLKFAHNWEKGQYTKGLSVNDYQDSDIRYKYNNRSAICDSKGNVLNSKKDFVYVGAFKNKYAVAYKSIVLEGLKIFRKQAGVIDIDGYTRVNPEYDGILLSEHHFARLRKGNIYGMANLLTKEIRMFDTLVNIKGTREIDEYGRCVYSVARTDNSKGEYEYGVLGFDGIVVPPGKYETINLETKGLIIVSNEEGLYGLLDETGKELLPLAYSYISWFRNGYATICVDGDLDEDAYFSSKGKWGIITDKGDFYQDCTKSRDEINELIGHLVIGNNQPDNIPAKPSIIVSDYISEQNYSYTQYYDDYDDSSDDGYSNNGGYNGYDDQTIEDAFEGDPSLTWNID